MILSKLEKLDKFTHSTITYNAIIKALGSRKDYAQEAIEYYHKMQIDRINIDSDTVVHTLKACSNCGDVKTAFNVLQAMK